MSLHALAGHMASKGRGSDSMLVHMTPEEVQSLQVLALKGGGTLTINPDTGLPEANFLKKMLPMIAGLALAPLTAGTSLAFLGATPLASALTVGGITGLATGSLSRGLMAGLGAYGGASLGAGLAGAGAGAAQEAAVAGLTGEQLAQQAAAQGLTEQGVLNQAAATATKDFMAQGAGSQLAQGTTAALNNPKALMSSLGGPMGAFKTAYAAATPMLAADMVQTTTPRSETTPSYIRAFDVDPYTQRMQALTPIDASKVRLPSTNMAQGGIVALAAGGTPGSIEDLYKTYAGRGSDPSGLQYWQQQFGDTIDPNEVNVFKTAVAEARAQGTEPAAQPPAFTNFNASQINSYIADNKLDAAGIAAAAKQFNADPNAIINAQNAQETVANVYRNVLGRDPDPVGLEYWSNQVTSGERTGQEMYQEFLKGAQSELGKAGEKEIFRPGISLEDAVKPFAGYSSSDKRNIADEWVRNTLGREVTDADRQQQWYKDATSAAAMNTYDAAQNIFGQFKDYATRTGQNPVDAYADAMSKIRGMGLTEADVLAQTGKSLRELVRGPNLGLGLFQASQLNAPGSGFDLNTLKPNARATGSGADGYYGNPTGPAPTPGDIVTNPDGSRTVVPNIPGRPTGGFAGMQQVKDAYTAGGGSLGYTPYAPATLQEFQNRYTNTGGSKQAYDYLMNKGEADVRRPITKTGELMLPYADVMGLRRPGAPVMRRAPDAKKEELAPQETTVGGANGGVMRMALGGLGALAGGGSASQYNLGSYSDGGRLLRGPGDGVSDSIPATIGGKQPARLADGEFVVPARIVSELGNGSTEAGARKLYAMMDRVQKARGKTTGKNRVAANTRSDKYLPA